MARQWKAHDILSVQNKRDLIILNQPILNLEAFKRIWKNTRIHVCADGGLNQLYHHIPSAERHLYTPDYVLGDFDSLEEDTRKYYTHDKVKYVHEHDQDKTDFQKCLEFLFSQPDSARQAIVLGGLSGRLDHTIGVLHTLYKFLGDEIVVCSKESIAWLLPPGKHEIVVDPKVEGPTCGLFSLNGRSVCKTTDEEMVLEFGQLVSTSNVLEVVNLPHVVTVETDKPVVWTMENHY